MDQPAPLFARPFKGMLLGLAPSLAVALIAGFVVYKYVNPAPPSRIVISTSDGEGDYQHYAKLYKDIIKDDGVELVIRPSTGAAENFARLKDPKSDVDVGFVQDGLGTTEEAPDVSSLGSLYYEPIWVFYRAKGSLSRLSQLMGKRIAVGRDGGGTKILSEQLLHASGLDRDNSRWVNLGWDNAAQALRAGQVDAAVFLATPDEPVIKALLEQDGIRLMNMDQAEAITRQMPFLHHLVLPHGALDLRKNLPAEDVHLVSPTATLLVRDSLHSALMYLLLKAASEVHSEPGIFELKDEFPKNKDYQFPLSDEAKSYYKSGTPFWQRYLPFWIATLMERFILFVIPVLALVLPTLRLVPRYLQWRVKSRIYQRYGEVKYLETLIRPDAAHGQYAEYMEKLDGIEERVNHMKVPLGFADHIYVLREHIDFVRKRLARFLGEAGARVQ